MKVLLIGFLLFIVNIGVCQNLEVDGRLEVIDNSGFLGQAITGKAKGSSGIGIYGEALSNESWGVYGFVQGDEGQAIRGKSIGLDGIGVFGTGNGSTSRGVVGFSLNNVAVTGNAIKSYGVLGSSTDSHGSYFIGKKSTGFADIVLGGTGNSGVEDNGVIMSDPAYGGSDMFLISNDAVVVRIDNNQDANEGGNFIIQDGAGTNLFQVTEEGNVLVKGSTVHTSDRNQKEEITDIVYYDVLQSVLELPIYEWQYNWENRRHIGPMAQDFHAAFGLGDDDKIIASIDADGIALAAIKAQQEIISNQKVQIDEQQSELDQLKQEMTEIRAIISTFYSLDKGLSGSN